MWREFTRLVYTCVVVSSALLNRFYARNPLISPSPTRVIHSRIRKCLAYYWSTSINEIPEYITTHAPLVYLYSEERYFPGSIEEFATQFMMSTANYNYTEHPLSISNLTETGNIVRELTDSPDADLFMTSRTQWEPEPGPDWLTGYKKNRPNIVTGRIDHAIATLIVIDKPHINSIDAFWFYFYPFNLGPFVMGHGPFGNHIGDWEHTLVRFDRKTKKPKILWMSAHGGGTAYEWDSLLDQDVANGTRPVIFSARGTHAQYTAPGRHPHDIPWHMLSDYTDRGDLWDPAKNYIAYTLNGSTIHPGNGSEPNRELEFGDWLLFDGHWGNAKLNKTDIRQQWSPFEFKIIDGPLGPLYKNLQRTSPCERNKWWNLAKSCRIRKLSTPGEGIDSDTSGCTVLLTRVPHLLRPVIKLVTANGYFCFWSDRLLA